MARSKQLHFIQETVTIEQPSNPHDNWADGVIQVDVNLSEKFGRTIRNGNQFRLVGFGSQLRGFGSSQDLDLGFAGVLSLRYCPVTANSVGAHQKMYKAWTRQKRLASAVGEYIRYDDFEVGWDASNKLDSLRQSAIFMEGLADSNDEDIVLYGDSSPGSTVTLEGYYDKMNPIALPSTDYSGAVIKTAKFTDKFPDFAEITMSTSFSSMTDTSTVPDTLGGAIATGDLTFLPADNHLSHMTGTLFYYFKGVAPDTAATAADELKLIITLVYEGWSSIAPSSQRRITSRKTSKKTSARTTKQSRRS